MVTYILNFKIKLLGSKKVVVTKPLKLQRNLLRFQLAYYLSSRVHHFMYGILSHFHAARARGYIYHPLRRDGVHHAKHPSR